ncbi:MAG: hypothetical protein HFH98_05175 [Lachnospiraceae bacterium]|nr:hypothetical protein [uncultured Acetatifactor sp.]MCI9651257.1 hypothetical protein [Lachnospiraceae bacterium]
MIILDKPYTVKELNEIKPYANGFVKGVVDLNQELVALDADMHYELADYLKEQRGSKKLTCGDLICGLRTSQWVIFWNMILSSISIIINFMAFRVAEWEYWMRISWQEQRR